MKKSLGKRIVSGVTSALLAASAFAQSIPLGNSGLLKARAATNLGGNGEVDDVTLLVGSNPRDPDGNPYGTFESVDAAVAQYEKDYLLGIAGRFCVFLEEDFKTDAADAEGRMALGGSFTCDWAYEIGKGDFNTQVPLSELVNNDGMAEIIWDGKDGTTFYKINTNGYYEATNNGGYDGKYNDNSPKKVIVVQQDSGESYVKNEYSSALNQFYKGSLIDFSSDNGVFKTLIDRSEALAEKDSSFDVSIHPNEEKEIEWFKQTSYDSMGGIFETLNNKGVATFTYTGDQTAQTVYLKLNASQWEEASKCAIFSFEDIPEDAYIVINVVGVNDSDIQFNTIYDNSQDISFNTSYDDPKKDYLDHKDRYTFINGKSISKGAYTAIDDTGNSVDLTGIEITVNKNTGKFEVVNGDEEVLKKVFDTDVYNTSNWYESNISGWYNNYPSVDRLLYNFSDAKGKIDYGKGAIQGTILAPNANVKALEETGHLSGALIAKSFEGKTEFGYRPFTGPISMLGLESNYTIDLYKLDDETGLLLDGATFGLFPVTTKDGKNEVATEPSIEVQVKNGKITTEIPVGRYVLKEIKAPTDYALDNETSYYIEVTENEKNRM